jgi:hypothetical protein
MNEQPVGDDEEQLEQLQLLQMVLEIRQRAFLQIVYGLLWWMGSAIAMAIALSLTGDSVYWFGGALGSLFHWYRAVTMINATRKVGAKTLLKKESVLIGVTALLVVSSTLIILPEYSRIETPAIGTCWGDVGQGNMVPVACWSPNASAKTVAYSNSAELCPSTSTGYFDPSSRESRFTCLIDS